jgi:hypothetical protein
VPMLCAFSFVFFCFSLTNRRWVDRQFLRSPTDLNLSMPLFLPHSSFVLDDFLRVKWKVYQLLFRSWTFHLLLLRSFLISLFRHQSRRFHRKLECFWAIRIAILPLLLSAFLCCRYPAPRKSCLLGPLPSVCCGSLPDWLWLFVCFRFLCHAVRLHPSAL